MIFACRKASIPVELTEEAAQLSGKGGLLGLSQQSLPLIKRDPNLRVACSFVLWSPGGIVFCSASVSPNCCDNTLNCLQRPWPPVHQSRSADWEASSLT